MAHRPLIGVVPLWDDTLNSLWMLPGYFDGIIEAGGIPVMRGASFESERETGSGASLEVSAKS